MLDDQEDMKPSTENMSVSWLVCGNEPDEIALNQTLSSIAEQTHKNQNLIFVANGSEYHQVSSIAKKILRNLEISSNVIETSASGLTYSLNVGLHFCEHDYLARLDVGDIAMPNRIKLQLEEFLLGDSVLAGVGGQFRLLHSNKRSNLPIQNWQILRAFVFSCPLCHPAMLMKTSVIKDVGGYMGFLMSEDVELWLRIINRGYEFRNISDVIIEYEAVGGSARHNLKSYAGVMCYHLYFLFVQRSPKFIFSFFIYMAKFIFTWIRSISRRFL